MKNVDPQAAVMAISAPTASSSVRASVRGMAPA
jgi:hypothetical protein